MAQHAYAWLFASLLLMLAAAPVLGVIDSRVNWHDALLAVNLVLAVLSVRSDRGFRPLAVLAIAFVALRIGAGFRGALIDTPAVIEGLKSGQIGYLAIDVYEEEGDLFYQDLSNRIVTDDVFARLLTFPNVLVTGHQAYLTHRALRNIAETTLQNLTQFEATGACHNEVTPEKVKC